MSKHKLGWIPQYPDSRDYKYSYIRPVEFPTKTDLRPQMPEVYNQENIGSCTAQAIGAAFQFNHVKNGLENFIPSRLFIYFNERVIENTVRSDAGAMIRDGIKSVAKQGVPPESFWPYITERFDIRPTQAAYQEAKKHTAVAYSALPPSISAVRSCLAEGYPVIFGFTVYESFDSIQTEKTGLVNLPDITERAVGGHAVLAVGYDDEKHTLIVRNSWGKDWGDEGYCYFPYDYMTSGLTSDFWTIRNVV